LNDEKIEKLDQYRDYMMFIELIANQQKKTGLTFYCGIEKIPRSEKKHLAQCAFLKTSLFYESLLISNFCCFYAQFTSTLA
jgi:hypothetical protein